MLLANGTSEASWPIGKLGAVLSCLVFSYSGLIFLGGMKIPPKNVIGIFVCTSSLVFFCLTNPTIAGAATHWVSPTGAAAWSSCSGTTPLSGTGACSLSTANTNAAAGDLVYLRGGTYSGTSLSPVNSGSCPSTCYGEVGATMIVFSAYTGEVPIISGVSTGLMLSGVNWVKVTGITFQDFTLAAFTLNNGASYDEISYNSFVNIGTNYSNGLSVIGSNASSSGPWSTHVWFHHNYLSRAHNSNPCGEATDLMRVGMDVETGSGDQDDYNTVEYNYLEYGGHSVLQTNSRHNVIRGNIGHNEPWIPGCNQTSPMNPVYDNAAYNGMFGHRVFEIGQAAGTFSTPAYNLVEGNRAGYAGAPPSNDGAMDIDLEAGHMIVRYNFAYSAMASGIDLKYGNSFGPGTGAFDNHVYNNTVYQAGHGYNAGVYVSTTLQANGDGIAQFSTSGNTNNVITNNLLYQNGYESPSYPAWDICSLDWFGPNVHPLGSSCSPVSLDTVSHNWFTSNGDPKFNNADTSNTLSQDLFSSVHGYAATALPDLTLQSDSPVIDGGTYLTTASGAGSASTTLVVADALFFQDGTWGSDLSRTNDFFPDWIAIGTVGNTVQIRSINYSNNTITLSLPMTWSTGAPIWLYKKSDGAVVLSGAAPDYGASEYGVGGGGGGSVAPPSGLQAVIN